MDIYSDYKKPSFSPPGWLFGPVWTILYILIAISFGIVFVNVGKGNWPKRLLAPFIFNLVVNLIYFPMQFIVKNRLLATIDIFLILGSIIWMMVEIQPYSNVVMYMQIPYLLWVSFASVLQISIYIKNK